MSESYDTGEPLVPYDSDTASDTTSDPDDPSYVSDNEEYFIPFQQQSLDQRGSKNRSSCGGLEQGVRKPNPLTARPTGSSPDKAKVGTTATADPSVPCNRRVDPTPVPEAGASTLQMMQACQKLKKSVAHMQHQLQTLTASQQLAQTTEELSLMSPKIPSDHNPSAYLFDPSGLLGDKYFSGATDAVCQYLTKYFAQPLNAHLTTEMAKQFKRPDIHVMKVQRLDDMFQRKDLSYMKARDYTFKEIHKDLLHAVGPIAELLAKLPDGHQVEPVKLIQYKSATLILMGSSAARILAARRKNAIREFNHSLITEVSNLSRDNDTNLVFGSDNLND